MAVRNFRPGDSAPVFTPLRRALLALTITLTLGVLFRLYTSLSGDFRFRHMEYYLQVPALIALGIALLQRFFGERSWFAWVDKALRLVLIAATAGVLFVATPKLALWFTTPPKVYWNMLANAFLHGRLYMINPPTTHDLTLFNGNWYVPNPPLPALVALRGVQAINMVWFSVAVAAITVALVFWILQEASARKLIPTGPRSNLWLTAMFALGTDFWWLSVMAQMWFLSQLLTLLCAAVAVLFVIKKASPWWAGLWLGLAVLARPNIFTLWPLLAGLYLFLYLREHPTFDWKRALGWAIQSAAPVVAAVAALLIYNYVRFDDFMNFGYTTLNGATDIVTAAQTYGLFNVHFVADNLRVMFLDLPRVVAESNCWVLDFILPVLLLIGTGLGRKPEWPFKALVLLGVAANFLAILYWFRLLCY